MFNRSVVVALLAAVFFLQTACEKGNDDGAKNALSAELNSAHQEGDVLKEETERLQKEAEASKVRVEELLKSVQEANEEKEAVSEKYESEKVMIEAEAKAQTEQRVELDRLDAEIEERLKVAKAKQAELAALEKKVGAMESAATAKNENLDEAQRINEELQKRLESEIADLESQKSELNALVLKNRETQANLQLAIEAARSLLPSVREKDFFDSIIEGKDYPIYVSVIGKASAQDLKALRDSLRSLNTQSVYDTAYSLYPSKQVVDRRVIREKKQGARPSSMVWGIHDTHVVYTSWETLSAHLDKFETENKEIYLLPRPITEISVAGKMIIDKYTGDDVQIELPYIATTGGTNLSSEDLEYPAMLVFGQDCQTLSAKCFQKMDSKKAFAGMFELDEKKAKIDIRTYLRGQLADTVTSLTELIENGDGLGAPTEKIDKARWFEKFVGSQEFDQKVESQNVPDSFRDAIQSIEIQYEIVFTQDLPRYEIPYDQRVIGKYGLLGTTVGDKIAFVLPIKEATIIATPNKVSVDGRKRVMEDLLDALQ